MSTNNKNYPEVFSFRFSECSIGLNRDSKPRCLYERFSVRLPSRSFRLSGENCQASVRLLTQAFSYQRKGYRFSVKKALNRIPDTDSSPVPNQTHRGVSGAFFPCLAAAALEGEGNSNYDPCSVICLLGSGTYVSICI